MRSAHVGRVLLLLITLFGCQKNDIKVVPPDPPAVPVTGQLILPDGSSLISKQLMVTNGIFEAVVTQNEFSVDTTALANTFTFVTDEEHHPYLIKYYDGSSDLEISPHSTALALIMSSPVMIGVTTEGRRNLKDFVSGSSEFATLENSIKENLLQGRPITDTTNLSLRAALLNMFDKIVANGTAGDSTSPILITREGRSINVANNGAANAYVAGLYKDGQRVNTFVINGTPRYASSPVQAIGGMYLPSTGGDVKTISIEGDGNFELKIRSGNPTVQDGSQENFLAAKLNIVDFAFSFVQSLLPTSLCLNDVKTDVQNDYDFDIPTMSGSLFEVSNAVYGMAEQIIDDNIASALQCYSDQSIFSRFAETVVMYTRFMGSVSRSTASGMNVTPPIFHMYYNQQQFDFCYTATGANVTDCNAPSTDTLTYLGFYALPGTGIGDVMEFRLAFSGNIVLGYATSTAFDFGSGKQTAPVSGTIDGSSMTLLIHTDNGVKPELVDCSPEPEGSCATCRYTGDHVVQDWVITGTINDDHSAYNAEYTRKYVYTGLAVDGSCTPATVVDEVEENGVVAY